MDPIIRLHQQQRADLAGVLKLPKEELARIVRNLSQQGKVFLTTKEFNEFLNVQCPDQGEAMSALARLVIQFISLQRNYELSLPQMASALTAALDRSEFSNSEKADPKQWKSLVEVILQIVDSSILQTLSKALELSYDFTNLIINSKILTDIRPIFDAEPTKINAGVITFTLQLEFSQSQDRQAMSFAMDLKDVRKLRVQCDRALKKSEIAKSVLLSQSDVPVIVAGQD